MRLYLAFVIALLAWSGSARADDIGQSLELTEEPCLTRERVAERLTQLLAGIKVPDGLRMAVHADANGTTTFEVSVPGEEVGTRTFETAGLSCENKLSVVSFALAVAIEGILESRAKRLRAPPPPAPLVRPAPPPPAPKPPAAHLNASAGEGLVITRLGAAPALRLGLEREAPRYALGVSVMQTLSRAVRVDPGSVRYELTIGRAFGCLALRRLGRACAFADVGSFGARGIGYLSRGASGRSLWVAAGLAAEANVRLSQKWTLRPSAAPFAILRGPTLDVTDSRTGQITASSGVPRLGVLLSLEIAYRLGE